MWCSILTTTDHGGEIIETYLGSFRLELCQVCGAWCLAFGMADTEAPEQLLVDYDEMLAGVEESVETSQVALARPVEGMVMDAVENVTVELQMGEGVCIVCEKTFEDIC